MVNVGTGEDVTIRELAETVWPRRRLRRRIVFDASKPDGTPRKLLDVSKLSGMGWTARIAQEDGIRATYGDFLARYPSMQHAPIAG